MGTILTIVVVAALIGGAISFLSSGKGEDAVAGAAGGAMFAGGCLLQLLVYGIVIFLAITVFIWVFG